MITSKVNDSYISIGDAYSGDQHIETIYDKDGNIVFSSSKAIKSPPPISFYQKFRYSNNLIETLTTTGYISATDAMYYAITSNIFSPEFSLAYEDTSVVGFASTKICRLKTTKYIKKLYFRTGNVFIDDSDYGRKVRIFYPSGTLVDSITNISPNTILEFYIAIEFASNDPLYINKLPPEHMTDIFMDITPYDIETYPEDEYLHPNDDNFISLVLGENAKCDYEKAGVKIVDKPISNYRIYGNTVDGESVGDRTANLFNGELQNGYWSTLETLAQTSSAAFRSFKIFLPAGTYTITFATNVNIVRLIADGAITQNIGNNLTEYTFTTQTNDDVGFSFRITGTTQVPWDNSDIMLNIGSVAIPYEPYGYRVPVTIEGKNLLQNTVKSQTKNGVTFTVNNDGSITCNGTASNNTFLKIGDLSLTSQSYILTGCPSDGGNDSYALRCYKNGNIKGADVGNGFNINESIDGYIEIRIASGYTCDNLTFYPMICKADIKDDTYEPYHEPTTTNLYLPEQIKKLGFEAEHIDYREQKMHKVRKNLLPVVATSKTVTGVTFTVNVDKSITCNGRNNGTSDIIFEFNQSGISLEIGRGYIISGCPEGGAMFGSYAIKCYNGSYWVYDDGHGAAFPAVGTGIVRPQIIIPMGVTVNNLTFYPMIRTADIEDDTYEPYIENTDLDVTLPALPILSGTNTLSVVTEVQPSNVYLKGRIKEVSI